MNETTDGRTFVRVYTGNGQGKSTAAMGVAVRVLCSGKRVLIAQFVKDEKYSETRLASMLPDGVLEIEQLGGGCFISRQPEPHDVDAARRGLEWSARKMASGDYGLVVLDELTIAIYYNLLTRDEVLNALSRRHPATEVIVTGRYAPQWLIDAAQLVTDMQEVKHYYQQGVLSRTGYDH